MAIRGWASIAVFLHLELAFAAQVSLPAQSAVPGVVPILFEGQGDLISGVQFDVEYDNAVFSITAIPGSAVRLSGKVVYSADVTPRRKRFLIVGFNSSLVEDGPLIELNIGVRSGTVAGTFPLRLSSVRGTEPAGVDAEVHGSDGLLTIGPPQGLRVLNTGSMLSGPVAPGEFVTLLGMTSGETSVTFDGTPAMTLYWSLDQINTVVPYSVAGHNTTRIQTASGEVTVPVAPAAPALFTLDSSGVGPAACLNPDATVNSAMNPASKGSIVALFATGAGQTDPSGMDGRITTGEVLPKPLLSASVTIGGKAAEVLYAGAAPGLIAGVLQINVVVPVNIETGFAIPVVLTVGGVSSPLDVTIAIQ